MKKAEVLLINQIAGSQTGGFTGEEENAPTYLETLAPTYLRSHFYETFCAEPVFFMQLAAQLREKGIQVEILDGLLGNYNKESLKEAISEYDTSIYCFDIKHSSYFAVIEMMKEVKAKNHNAIIITGGTYGSIVYKQLLEKHHEIDYVVIGDADDSLPLLCKNLLQKNRDFEVNGVAYRANGEIKLVPPIPVDVNNVMPLARDLDKEILLNNFSFSMVSSRGCGYGVCSFCYLPPYQTISNHPKWRGRSPKLMVEEIESLQNRYGINRITFVDEDYFGPNKEGIERAIAFADLLIEKGIKIEYYANCRINSVIQLAKENLLQKLYDSGLRYLFIGIESGSDRILKKYKKGITSEQIKRVANTLREYGIKINPGLITFDPQATIDDIKDSVDVLKLIEYYDVFMFTRKLVILPGTEVDNNNSSWNLPDPSIRNQNIIVPEDYFEEKNTCLLYQGLKQFRDLLYPIYARFTNKNTTINETDRNLLIKNHFDFFYELYEKLKVSEINSLNGVQAFVNERIDATNKIISLIEAA